jgi:GNAT superfamily N-acetyltransferase
MTDFAIRRLRSCDSLDALTHVLHRAFEDLARRGIECQCANQSVDRTNDRVKRGECFIAVSGSQMIGTITLEHPDRSSAIEAYRDLATASVHQLAVDPANQGAGVGGALIAYASAWAGARRYERLALDTPQGASREVAWYIGRGFDLAQTVHVLGRRYASVVLTKELPDFATRRSGQARMDVGVLRPGKVQWVSANDSSVDVRRPYRVAT